jgi:putative membrane protein
MSEREFLEAAAKQRAKAAVREVEAQTAVEVVIAVRRRAARYVMTSVLFGAACACAGFLVMWFSPREYDVRTMPLDVLLAFLLGAGLVLAVPRLRRLLTPNGRLERNAEAAAKQAFGALGIEKTRGRTGVLVYVSLFERTAVLVPDSGVPEAALTGARAALKRAVARLDLADFFGALGQLGPACAAVLPRQPDDENELCDDVV